MQRPRPESKEGAARTRSHTATSRVDVIVLTTDSALLAVLREAAGSDHELFCVESPESAVDLLVGGHCGIFIVDVSLVQRNVVELIEKLQSQFPEVVLLATGRREAQNAVAALVGSGRIYRFLHKPVSPARAELFLSAAARRFGELHPHDSQSLLTVGSLASPRNLKIFGGALAAVVLIASGAWFWPGAQPGTPTKQAAPSNEQLTAQLAALLAKADAAYAAGDLVPPSSGNALALYRAALQIDSSNQAAHSGVERIVATIEAQTNDALAARDVQGAGSAMSTLQRIAPTHPRLAELQAALATARRTREAAQSPTATRPAAANAATPASLGANAPASGPVAATPNIDLAKAYIAAKQLIEPSDASALGLLRRAREAGENDSALQITATDVGTRLLNDALAAVDSGNTESAKSLYAAAANIDREFGTSLPDLELVAERIRTLENSAKQTKVNALLEHAIQLRLSGQLLEPAGDNAFDALQAAWAEDSTSAEAKTEQQRLSFALLEATRTALASGDIDRADVLASRAEEILPGMPQTRALREQIGIARTQRQEASSVVQAASLPRRREVPAIYPRDALRRELEGWVDLEFTISEAGVPSDIRVKAAEPPRIFEIAASQALRQWRFEPILRDGLPQARRATLRMEFKLKG